MPPAFPHAVGAGSAAAPSYCYLGVTVSLSLNWAARWRKSCGPLNTLNALFFYCSSIMWGEWRCRATCRCGKLSPARTRGGCCRCQRRWSSTGTTFATFLSAASSATLHYAPNTSKLAHHVQNFRGLPVGNVVDGCAEVEGVAAPLLAALDALLEASASAVTPPRVHSGCSTPYVRSGVAWVTEDRTGG